jgi:hypothetical protein
VADDGEEVNMLRRITAANRVVEGVDGGSDHAHQQVADTPLRYRHILQLEAVRAPAFL